MVNNLKEKADEIKEARKDEPPAVDTGTGDKPKASGLIDTAHAENERMEKLLKELKEENNRREEIYAKQQLAGRADSGVQTKEKTQDDLDQEAADKITSQFI